MTREAEALFHELADLQPPQRDLYLREHNIAPSVRAEVEDLLRFDKTENNSLTACVAKSAEPLLPPEPAPASSCGSYRLVRVLGRGGMGAVYLAERADGEVEQQVAVKFLRSGDEEPVFRDRFLRERQILATLSHPGIARLLDAGHTTDTRQPYLVMDYIDGMPIDVFAANLPLRDKLELFLQVCEAVSHAHQNLIVHRDLKPSNILVDRSGRPKLLDFGIAKILEPGHEPTQTREWLLTPEYASPEQASGATQSTATDIYSLGAVLYKLLTGRSPHALDGAKRQQMLTAICSEEAVPPSRLQSDIPRDLDFILGKALRKEPAERYRSVEALADDLRALLEWRPVRARSGGAWYRLRRFSRRYWAVIAGFTLVVASLSGGLYLANRQRIIAQERFQQLRQLSTRIFDLDRAIQQLPGSTEARRRLVAASLAYLEGLSKDAHGDLDLAQELADGYARIARVQGVPVELNLGQMDEAEKSLRKADGLIDSVLAARPRSRAAIFRSAVIAHDLMIVSQSGHRRPEALAYAARAVQRLDTFEHLGPASTAEREDLARYYGNVAIAYRNLHLFDQSVRYAQKRAELARTLPSPDRQLSVAYAAMASALRAQGKLTAALEAIQQARRLDESARNLGDVQHMIDTYGILWREGMILGEDGGISLDRPAEAVAPLREALNLAEEAARRSPNDYTSRSRLAAAARDLGNILRHQNPRQALEVYNLGLRRLAETGSSAAARRDRALLLAGSSYALCALRQPAAAKRVIDEAFALLRENHEYPSDRITFSGGTTAALAALGDYYADQGDARRALDTYRQLLDKVMASQPDPSHDLEDANNLGQLYRRLAPLYRRSGDAANAAAFASRRLDLWREWDRQLPHNEFGLRQMAARD